MPDDITAIEKRPGSLRLNLADFGVVYKTTFAKGTISDFQKVQDDPIQVQSLAKVKGAWGESDFIPLFWCPKKQYWDSPDHQAQDFNESGKYYENAWMSFRGGDEVVVLLKEGVPVAVLGFADGVSRLGEALFHVDASGHECEAQMSALAGGGSGDIYGGDWDLNMKGPDGKELKLVKKIEPIFVQSYPDQVQYFWGQQGGGAGIGGDTHYYEGGATETEEWYRFMWKTTTTYQFKLYAYLIPVGPILYSLRYILVHNHAKTELWVNQGARPSPAPDSLPDNYQGADPPDVGGDWTKSTWEAERSRTSWPSAVVTNVFIYTGPDGTNYYHAMVTIIGNGQVSIGINSTPIGYNQENDGTDDWIAGSVMNSDPLEPAFNIGAALYDPTLTDPMSDKFIPQTMFNTYPLGVIFNWVGQGEGTPLEDIEDVKVYVRPHTKAELQAAGMWPW